MSITNNGACDNVKAILTKNGQIITIWRVLTTNNISTIYAIFMESSSFNIIKHTFRVSENGDTDAKDNL